MRTREELMPALSARSVALSLLLGSQPPRLTARDLTGLGEMFGIAASTMRVALSRMTSAGDLVAEDGSYLLSARHRERHAAVERQSQVRRRPYDGMWRMVVVVDRGREPEARAGLRACLSAARLAELREGVWLRPDNLADLDLADLDAVETFTSIPADDRALCRRLWDLDTWAAEARLLLDALVTPAEPVVHLTTAAAALRHLRDDPALPEELAPERWPADELRWAYADYRRALSASHLDTLGAAVPAGATQPTERGRT